MIKLGHLNKKVFSWKTNLPNNMILNHNLYWKDGILYHMIASEGQQLADRPVKDFRRECGIAYDKWCESGNANSL